MNKKQLKFLLRCEICRKDFWEYCKEIMPAKYQEKYTYLRDWCYNLQNFYLNGKKQDALILNAPPRHQKSLTLQLFVSWLIGINYIKKRYNIKIVVACYSKTLSIKFSTGVKNFMNMRQANDFNTISFLDVFPGCEIRRGFDKKEEWRIKGSEESTFLTTSPGAASTGFGCDVLIIDDMYKSIDELYSESYSEKLNTFIFSTLTARFEHEKKTIVSMTRWGKNDICQQIINSKNEKEVQALQYKAKNEKGEMLNPDILTESEYNKFKATMGIDAFLANYQQEFINKEGTLYKNLKTYAKNFLPTVDAEGKIYQHPVYCVCDLADKGTDYLSAIFYTIFDNYFYIVDIYYTNKQMSDTESEFAKKILLNNCIYVLGEGNNGGELYLKNVERIYKEMGGNSCSFNTFTQTKNKETRILSQVSWIEQNVFFPASWSILFTEFFTHIINFQADFRKNKHDDAADSLTILADCYNKTFDRKPAYISNI